MAEESSEEAQAATLTADTPEEAAAEGPESGAEKGAGDSEATAAENVDIPKQQSADEAADNEAGESARK
ncbi:gliding motility protein [Streptomyces sp. ISL-99]|uniref:gliding motility protein n=1 Tax=Streptomyces sp. ISL-99 TaxID=2819193 RepID=UPI0027E4ACBE|nr:gliding motility protein [Streptomyces sp. ISL-99]